MYVIADADATFPSNWLADLVAPLSDPSIGISTTFPYFKPIAGFWSRAKMVWGLVGQSLMESDATRFGWGGSLAFRTDLLGKKALAYFKGAISDDTALTKIAKARRLKIAYVRSARPVIYTRERWSTFIEWADRQSALFSAGSSKAAYYGIAFYSLSLLLLVSAVVLSVTTSLLFLIFLIPFAAGIIKSYKRSATHYPDLPLVYLVVQVLYLVNLLRATQMETIAWRGRRYPVQHLEAPSL